MAAGDNPNNGTDKITGPEPITSPFDWGLGSAITPPTAAPVPVAPPAPTELITSAPLEPAAFFTPALAERHPEPYFTSDSEGEGDPASPIHALFGETQFRDYEGEPLVGPIPTELNPFASAGTGAARAANPASAYPSETLATSHTSTTSTTSTTSPPSGPQAPFSKNQKLMFWVAGGVIALLVLAVLFVIGTKSSVSPAPVPVSETKTAAPKVAPSPTPASSGPAAAGVRLWNTLRGGECVDPYTNPFELRFTVVDCAAPHSAQMVLRSTFPGEATAAYPGLDALQSQINLLCSAPGVIDLATAGAYNDIQFQASYAATTEEWTKGQRDYFCFVNRSGGAPITGSVAGTPAK